MRRLAILQILLQVLQSQTILTMTIDLAIPVQLLTIVAAVAERTASAAILALLAFKRSLTATTVVS